ncbi:MAG: UvrD-helicase domain-containing protein, partial [Oribacterium sp.]|nr:UvrD-helicase domain-containing protein [Oribacterium sp.]
MENLEKILNKEQLEAVRYTEGPLLVLAGAGSGKTRVLTHRVAYLIENCEVRPWNILAITFTNKAAGEMRERVDKLIGARAREVWVSTFHSMCVRILRQHIEGLGYTSDFSIYDTDDQKTVMKQIFKELNIDTHELRERGVLSVISSAKNRGTDPSDFRKEIGGDYRERKIADCYELYEKKLRQNNALDFDDLLLRTIELFKTNEEVLEYYQNRFRYIMVDEYQDTNDIQFMLVQQLAGKYQNLCVVGDDDQSIYKFRGANVSIILNFEKYYPKAKVVKLEQNYRSTEKILNCANAVIANNAGRKPKKLWTAKAGGADVRFQEFENANDEAYAVIREVRDCGRSYQDQAILYRTNAQSRLLEEQCIKMNIPYQIVGGVNFYQRKEIKDILAYLKVIANGADNVAFTRIINVPKRGIGPGTVQKLTDYAAMHDGSLFGAAAKAVTNGIVAGKAGKELQKFCDMIEQYRVKLIDSGLLPAPDSNI